MTTESLTSMTIEELAPRIKSGEVSPVEVTEAALAQAERLQPLVNSFITILADEARQQAKEREAAIKKGNYRGPLDGIPIGIKDSLATKGIRSTIGSKVLRNNVPEEDAVVVEKCKEAGAIILGKENMEEFAMGGTSENPHYGPVHNPWVLDRIPGGSSGGSGANVAARITYASLGTDVAGSVRIPASYCGVVGLKPTFGRVSQRGNLGVAFNGDHVGTLTRSIADCALVLQVIAGNDPLDPSTVPVDVPNYSSLLGKPFTGLRVGVPTNYFFDHMDAEFEASVRSAISALGEMGAEVVEVQLHTVKDIEFVRTGSPDMFLTHETWLREQRQDYSPQFLGRLLAGQFFLARDYAKSMKVQRLIKDEFAKVLHEVDILATPTMAFPPRRIGAETVMISGKEYPMKASGAGQLYLGRNTYVFNNTGQPSISVPCGLTSEGLPAGLQLTGRPFEEALLLQVAAQYEQVSPSRNAIPDLVGK